METSLNAARANFIVISISGKFSNLSSATVLSDP